MTPMKKLGPDDPDSKSADVIAQNVERLKALFPEAFTEGKIDFDVLKQVLGGAVDEREEKYGLNWHGKRRARQLALTPSTGTLRPCPEESVDWDTTKNIFIEGDNLEVLKILQKSYAGRVKLIYIDPPYNTGKDFVYKDDFRDNLKNYLSITGQVDGVGNPLSTNTETSGRFHTDWMNMIYPRLRLSRDVLSDSGVVMVSIDDNEVDDLRAALNEIYGEENFIAQLVWEKGRKNDAKLFSTGHDYIVVYARSVSMLSALGTKWREGKPGAAEIQAEYLRLREIHGSDFKATEKGLQGYYASLPKVHPARKLSRYSRVDANGVWRDDNISWPGGGGPTFDVVHPATNVPCRVPEGGWRYSTHERMMEMIAVGRVEFRLDHTEPPIRKTYLVRETEDDADDLPDNDDVGMQVAGTYFYRSALQASNVMLKLFGAKVFDSPKDADVIARWIGYVCSPGNDDLVMDFFAGSGTTGDAVTSRNASDFSARRYVLVQLPELLDPADKRHASAIALCDQVGVPRNIAELTKERLRRSGSLLRANAPLFPVDVGFRVFKLAESGIETWAPARAAVGESIAKSLDHLKSSRTEQDLLFELLLKRGLDLCVPIEKRTIAGKTIHAIGGGVLFVCLAPSIVRADAEPLAEGIIAWRDALAPAGDVRCVFRDSAFADDVAKVNLAAILEQAKIADVVSI